MTVNNKPKTQQQQQQQKKKMCMCKKSGHWYIPVDASQNNKSPLTCPVIIMSDFLGAFTGVPPQTGHCCRIFYK